MKLKKNAAFTLTELTITILVIGILALSALPAFANISFQAQTAATRQIQAEMNSFILIYNSQKMMNNRGMISGLIYFDDFGLSVMTPEGDVDPIFPQGARPSVNAVVGNGIAAVVNDRMPNLSNPAAFCNNDLRVGAITGGGWIYYTQARRIFATTPDCTRFNPAA